jgi:hypothetical protein
MSKAKAKSTGLGIEDDGLEMSLDELPEWDEDKVKVLPMVSTYLGVDQSGGVESMLILVSDGQPTWRQCWKNPSTGKLHIQVHPCGAHKLIIDPLPTWSRSESALYPDGGVIEDLKIVREVLYSIQRPGIAPEVRTSWIRSTVGTALRAQGEVSSSTQSIGRKRTWRCSITEECCIALLERSRKIRLGCFIR